MATTNKAFRVKSGLIVEGAELKPAAGTTAYPPILLTSGTNLTTATSGAMEFDGTNLYFTPASTRKTISFTDHTHGNILAGGTLTASVTTTSPVKVLITDSSNNIGLLTTTNAGATTFLRGDGTWIVPTDTNWYPTGFTYTAGSTAGPTGSLTGTGMTAVSIPAIPAAATGASGIITTGAQNIDGVKTFSSLPESSVVPTTNNQLTNKAYVDSVAVGIDWKPSVRLASTTNIATLITLSATIDGKTLVSGDRVLLKNQTTGSENGIWVVGSGNWARATDADTGAELSAASAVFVEDGDTQADTGWVLTNNGTVTIGTTALTFTQFTGLGQVTAGDGIAKSGNTLSVNLDSSPVGLKFNTAKLAVDASQLWIGTSNVFLSGTTPISQALTGILSITGTVANMSIKPADRTGVGTGYALDLNGGASDTSTGGTVTVRGGATTSANGNGGATYIYGGTGTGTGNGGTVYIDGGAHGTAANVGKVLVGGSSTQTEVGNTSYTTKLWGNVQVPNLASGSDTNFVKFNSTTKALTYDTTTYVGANNSALTGTTTFGTGNSAIVNASGSTTGTTALTLSTVYASGTYNGGEFIIKATNSTNIEITKVLVITDGTNVYMTTYGDVFVTADLVSVDFTYTGANVNMVVTPVAGTTGTTTVKVTGTLIAV
jgi:hypothetical protein